MDEFGLPEFTELTGVGVGKFSIYLLSATGISLPVAEQLADFAPRQQHEIHQAVRNVALAFPCEPAKFLEWYDATRGNAPEGTPKGKQGVSDFPLAYGFIEELRRHEEPSSHSADPSVSSGEIVSAFRVRGDERENAKWWDLRLRNPGRYRLTRARALRGVARRPSRWHPVLVAGWLIDQKFLTHDVVQRAMARSFPDYDVGTLQV